MRKFIKMDKLPFVTYIAHHIPMVWVLYFLFPGNHRFLWAGRGAAALVPATTDHRHHQCWLAWAWSQYKLTGLSHSAQFLETLRATNILPLWSIPCFCASCWLQPWDPPSRLSSSVPSQSGLVWALSPSPRASSLDPSSADPEPVQEEAGATLATAALIIITRQTTTTPTTLSLEQ